jgi:septal ring factor EnvC (AmiA/AmiB activator)
MAQRCNDVFDLSHITRKIEEKQKEIEDFQKQKEMLLKEEEFKNKQALMLSIKLSGLKESRDRIEKKIIETTLELNKYCTHEKTRTEEFNYPGGYLDRSEHRTVYYCVLCGEKVDENVEYGSFG